MKTHVLANNLVYLDFAPEEHVALTHSLYDLMAKLDVHRITPKLGFDAIEAYEFVYSVFLAEEAARRAGIPWLQFGNYRDLPPRDDNHAVTIVCTDDGSSWRITVEQLGFIELCIAENFRLTYEYQPDEQSDLAG